jgi:hypothetical protein
MKTLLLAILGLAAGSPAWGQSTDCPYLSAFTTLQQELPKMPPGEAVTALEHYRATHENPSACEGLEVERLIGNQEARMIFLSAGTARLNAQAIYHCTTYDTRTTRCDGVTIDDTAHPFSAGIQPRRLPGAARMTIASDRKNTTLVAVYQARLSDLLDGKAATRLQQRQGTILSRPSVKRGTALIAIFKGTGPRPYTKAVWYL